MLKLRRACQVHPISWRSEGFIFGWSLEVIGGCPSLARGTRGKIKMSPEAGGKIIGVERSLIKGLRRQNHNSGDWSGQLKVVSGGNI